jgi:hypothetical protein
MEQMFCCLKEQVYPHITRIIPWVITYNYSGCYLRLTWRRDMTVWWMTINRAMGNSYLDLKHRKVIAQGWPLEGDLSIITDNFSEYWLENRGEFEKLMQLLARPVYPDDAKAPPKAFLNIHNLLSISKGDLVVAVESAQGAGPVRGICQVEKNAWES